MVYDVETHKEIMAHIKTASEQRTKTEITASEQRTKTEEGNLKITMESTIEQMRARDGKK